ncbi:MAG: TlpA disulfide reductase family protein [Saprospiraceae bacterium]
MNIKFLPSILILFFSTSLLGQIKEIPKANLNNEAGEVVEIQSYTKNGNPKLISIWATWCGPCRMELAALDKVYGDWKKKYNLEIVAASVDIPPMLKNAKAMFKKNGWDFTFLHDYNQELLGALGIRGIPYSILVDGNGKVASVQQGYFQGYEKVLEKKIAALTAD